MYCYLLKPTMVAAIIAAFWSPHVALAQSREWEESSPYYEDDAWYDISEWFDGNDYNPTDERIGVWNDETYHGAVDSSDQDNDYDYSAYDSSDYTPYANDNYNYNSTTGRDSQSNNSDSYYQSSRDNSTYDYAAILLDLNGDGLYDSMRSYQDLDHDGRYDVVRNYTFNRVSNQSASKSASQQQPTDSRKHQVQGKVTNQRTTDVKGEKHLLVTLQRQEDDKKCLVDLGPQKDLSDLKISKEDRISASGPMIKTNDRRILFAQEVEANGSRRTIDRNRKQFSGKVGELRTAQVQGKQHQLAILSSGQNKKAIVDLGCKEKLNLDLEQGDRITVKGAPVRIDDKTVVLAFEVQHDGQKTMIDRREESSHSYARRGERSQGIDRSEQSGRQASHMMKGKVTQTNTVSVRGKQHHVVTLKTEDGGSVLVDLGPKSKSKIEIQKGDRLTVRGPMVRTNDKRIVLATSIRQNGERSALRQPGENYSDAKQQTISGTVQDTRTAQVRGQERQLAKVKTDEGKTVLVDLGPAEALEADLSQGDEITARGAALKAGDQQVLVAFELETNDGGSVAISRE